MSDGRGQPISLYLSAGQTSDYIGAVALLSTLPKARALLADRGYDADWCHKALIAMISRTASHRGKTERLPFRMT